MIKQYRLNLTIEAIKLDLNTSQEELDKFFVNSGFHDCGPKYNIQKYVDCCLIMSVVLPCNDEEAGFVAYQNDYIVRTPFNRLLSISQDIFETLYSRVTENDVCN